MKKLIFGTALFGAMTLGGISGFGQEEEDDTSFDGGSVTECKDTVTRKGNTITVKVCNRRTDFLGLLSGRDCNAEWTSPFYITL
jgi:hypothetical protein